MHYLASYPGLPGRGRPGKTYHVTDITDCGQFQEHAYALNTGFAPALHPGLVADKCHSANAATRC